MERFLSRPAWGLGLAMLLLASVPAQAGVMDFLFGKRSGGQGESAASPGQRSWRIAEFTALRLVPREPGSAPNAHPVRIQPELLRQQLALVRAGLRGGEGPLFHPDELAELIEPIAQALSVAGPDDDLVLLSTSRRDGGVLNTPLGITARLFVEGGALSLIVHDARLDFVNAYIGSRIPPTFTFGSRGAAGATPLRSVSASSRRADWLAVPLATLTGPVAAAPAVPLPVVAPAPAPAATPAPPPPAMPAPAPRARDAAFADEVEQRLTTLKRLRDKNLITEAEYQQKRRQILDLL